MVIKGNGGMGDGCKEDGVWGVGVRGMGYGVWV